MRTNRLLPVLLATCCAALAGCDEAEPREVVQLRADSPVYELSEAFELRYELERIGPELTISLPEQLCKDGMSYATQTKETVRECSPDHGTYVEVTYTREDRFVCEEGVWKLSYSVCLYDKCSPQVTVTDEPCDAKSP